MSVNVADVSVIIPALNEENVIGACLDSLVKADWPREHLEVLVVDNGSADRTVEVARTFSGPLALTILKRPGVPVSALRNLGASRARGQIFGFLDSDCTVPQSWVQSAVRWLGYKRVGAVGAHFRIPPASRWVATVWYGAQQAEKQGAIAWLPGCNTWVTRRVFEQVGGFDEAIRTNEDCEFCDRVRARGLRIIGDASLAVVHLETPQTVKGFYRKIRWHATDGLRVFLRGLPRISNARPLLFGLYSIVCVAGAGVGTVLAAWRGDFKVVAMFIAALVMPAFVLSLRLVMSRKKWSHLLPLTLLHVVFGVARGRSLITWTEN